MPVVALTCVLLIVQLLATLIFAAVTESPHWIHVAGVATSLLLVAAWVRWRMHLNMRDIGLAWQGMWTVQAVLLSATVGVLLVATWILSTSGPLRVTFTDHLVSTSSYFSAFSVVLLSPIYEEAVYRGLYYPALKRSLGRGGALVAQAMLFSLLHFDFFADGSIERSAARFVLGGVLGLLYEYSRSLYSPIACHAAVNAGGVFLAMPLT